MGPVIKKYGGIIDKYIGDSIMVVFDILDNIEESITNALAAAFEMQLLMKKVNEKLACLEIDPLFMGIGIDNEQVVSGIVGSDYHREYTVIGNHVNIASRIEAFSLRGQILISHNTYDHIKELVEVGECNEVSMKGKSQAIKIYELLGINKPLNLTLPDLEARKFDRVNVSLLTDFQLLDEKKITPEVHQAEIRDISYGGLSLKTEIAIDKFTELRLRVNLSLFGMDTRDVYAKVVRLSMEDVEIILGLEFTTIDDDARTAIKNYVDTLIY